jgi:hypothetical protein
MLCREPAAADAWWGCCKQYSKKFKTGSEIKHKHSLTSNIVYLLMNIRVLL